MSAQHRIPPQLPANDPPEPRTMESIAEEFGFKNARAARDWCKRRGVPYRRDGKFNWVDRTLVRAVALGGPVVVAPPAEPTVREWVQNARGRRGT